MLCNFNWCLVKIFCVCIFYSQLSVFISASSPQNLVLINVIAVIDNHLIGDIVICQFKRAFPVKDIHVLHTKYRHCRVFFLLYGLRAFQGCTNLLIGVYACFQHVPQCITFIFYLTCKHPHAASCQTCCRQCAQDKIPPSVFYGIHILKPSPCCSFSCKNRSPVHDITHAVFRHIL